MDQLTAHLDRGWDLAQSGDARGAEASARRAVELAPDSPEAHHLLGYVAALQGDCEEAVEAYQQAIMLDDGYVEAMLNAAELLVHPLREFDEALELCDRVLDLTEYDDERLDALLLKFEAYWARGEDDEAARVLKRVPKGPFESPGHNFLAGRAFFELGDDARARPLLQAALEADPGHAEAAYYVGLLADASGDARTATALFLRVRQLEAEAGLPPWTPDEPSFLAIVGQAIEELPEPRRAWLRDAEVFIVDLPGPEVIVEGVDVHAMVLLDHVAARPGAALAESKVRLFVYAVNVLRTAGSLEATGPTLTEALARELEQVHEELAGNAPPN